METRKKGRVEGKGESGVKGAKSRRGVTEAHIPLKGLESPGEFSHDRGIRGEQ